MKELEDFLYVANFNRPFPGLKNTLLCSYSKIEEFLYYASKIPFYDRPIITANFGIPHNTVFYVDENGIGYKFIIPKEIENEW